MSDMYYGYCCRIWPLMYMQPVGNCGLCHKVPEFVGATLEEAKLQVELKLYERSN